MSNIDFATFCCAKDAARLHAPGQLRKQIESNGYDFAKAIVIHQGCNPADYEPFDIEAQSMTIQAHEIDEILTRFNIALDGQYHSPTDSAHHWRFHVVNHLRAIEESSAEYIVFADADCWIVRQSGSSWIEKGLWILKNRPDIFIVSPNDGEPERMTQVISQQVFLTRAEDFRQADFNQPGWDGDVTKHSEMPEYHAMLEGRIHHYCKATGRHRYVLGPEHRFWHHNRTNEAGQFETRYDRY